MCSAEPVSQAKRDKIERSFGAKLTDNFGMTEAGMMGGEWKDDEPGRASASGPTSTTSRCSTRSRSSRRRRARSARWWSPRCRPTTSRRSCAGARATSSPTAKQTTGKGPFSVFPRIKHAHRTAGFFKVRGVNLGHQDLEDFMFRHLEIGDFRAEALNEGGNDILRLSIEVRRGSDPARSLEAGGNPDAGEVRAHAAGGSCSRPARSPRSSRPTSRPRGSSTAAEAPIGCVCAAASTAAGRISV